MKFRYLQVYLCLIDARSKAVEKVALNISCDILWYWFVLFGIFFERGRGVNHFQFLEKILVIQDEFICSLNYGNKVWDFELLKLILKEEMNLSKVCSFHVHVQNDLIETLSVKMYRNSFPQFTWYVNLTSFYWKPVKWHFNVESKQSQN